MRQWTTLFPLLLLLIRPVPDLFAQETGAGLVDRIGIDQRLDAQVPPGLAFRDEQGNTVRLGDYFGEKPVVLALVYYQCPMLCGEVLNGMVKAFRALKFTIGETFEVVTVSIDPRETPQVAAAKKGEYMTRYGRPGTERGWHFLTGSPESIERLAEAVGFRYAYDAKSGLYAHAAAIIVLTPGGKISRYFYGVEYLPGDLRLALVEASANRIGSVVDQALLLCYRYDPSTGRYGLVIMRILQVAGIATVVAVGLFMAVMFRRDRRKGRDAHGDGHEREVGGRGPGEHPPSEGGGPSRS